MEKDPLSGKVIGCAIEVHRTLGPGLLESAYQQCLARELAIHDISFELERPLPIEYKGIRLDCGYRMDIVVENCLILELKVNDEILPIHHAQLITYLKLAKIRVGLLINFNTTMLMDGIKRLVY